MVRRVRSRIASALDRRFGVIDDRLEALAQRLERVVVVAEMAEARAATSERALRWLLQDHAENRRRLRELRAQASYEAVFDDAEPLISVVIPTYDNTELLLERSLPSILGQSHERLEVIVVGDAAAPEVGERVRGAGDARVRFVNLPYRIPHPDPILRWLVGSVAARNAGQELANGSWLVDFDDDDALRPRALERSLALAREQRLEVAYGPYALHWPDGRVETMSTFPPAFGRFCTQTALVHSGLGFFERNAAAGEFSDPNDWFRLEAMLRAGVRFGMHDEIVMDYFPSMRGRSDA